MALLACATPDDELDLGTSAEPLSATNGIQLNGIQLNGIQLNGIQLNGTSLSGTLSGVTKTGTQLAGATMTGVLSNGTTLPLRLDSIAPLAAPNQDVLAHQVSYWDGAAWTSLCGYDGAGAREAAIPLAGTWNLGQGVPGGGSWSATTGAFTFACRGAALAKCVELGYKPWAAKNGVSLRNHHQACTRLLRADYCGDGRPGTMDGWRLDVFDNLGIQAPTANLGWSFEARWAPSGALCMSSTRALDLIVSSELPACVASRVSATCAATDFNGGVLLKNTFDPWGLNVALQDAYDRYPLSRVDLQAAMERIQAALDALASSPPQPRDAVARVDHAVGKVRSALAWDLPPAYGQALMRRYALLSRSILVHEIARVQAVNPAAPALPNARYFLATGDQAIAEQNYPGAGNSYKVGVGYL